MLVRRRFFDVEGRRVHYLRVGEGPPALFIHSSPANVWIVAPHMLHLADRFTCFAFDTPGFGGSEPLPGGTLEVSDLADATAAAMDALGLPPCPVFGTHTGAAVALELGVRHPGRVTGIVFDGLPIFNEEELASIFDGYFYDLNISRLGGHFADVWTRFRDQAIWFPWTRNDPKYLNGGGPGAAADTHKWMEWYFRCAGTYKPAYYAACFYGNRAIAAMERLELPAVVTATHTDMLYPHLRRLPELRPGQSVADIGVGHERLRALIGAQFERFGACGNAPSDPSGVHEGQGSQRRFVDLPASQIHVRCAGRHDTPALLLIHDCPGSAALLEPLIDSLSARFFVMAPDLPGCGESDALPEDGRAIADYANALLAVLDSFDISSAVIYGVGFGASAALALAEAAPARADGVVIAGALLPDPAERADLRARLAPPITIEDDGSHWFRTWQMLRDSQIYWPWYRGAATTLRCVEANFDGERLHAWTAEVMKQRAAYAHPIEAALAHDGAAALLRVEVPLLICLGSASPLSAYDAVLRKTRPDASSIIMENDPEGHAADVAAFANSM